MKQQKTCKYFLDYFVNVEYINNMVINVAHGCEVY